MKFTHAQTVEAIKKLPQNTQDYITSPEATTATVRVADKYNLQKEQRVKFNYIVGTILLRLIDTKQAENELMTELSLPPEQARAVAGEVEREIFNNTNYEQDAKVRTEVKQAPQAPLQPTNFQNSKLPNLPTPPRPVSIRKPAPPPPPRQSSLPGPEGSSGHRIAGQAPQFPTIQSLLADIKKGTAYDDRRINEAYRKTPIEVRQTLESVGFLSRLENIAKKFGLNVEETGELVSESGLVMLGLTLPVHFVDNLGKRLRLPRDRAMAVGQAVNMEVLRPVREILRKMGQPIQNTPPPGGGELRFAPNIQPPTNSQNPPPRLIGGQATPSFIKEGEAGGGFSPQKYTTDPYREPLE